MAVRAAELLAAGLGLPLLRQAVDMTFGVWALDSGDREDGPGKNLAGDEGCSRKDAYPGKGKRRMAYGLCSANHVFIMNV